MPKAFDFSSSPFDCLTEDEQQIVRRSVDIGYYREGETLLEPGIEPTHLFVIIKGCVSQLDGDECVARYGPSDCFDGRSIVTGRASSRFVAAEEVVTYQLAREAVHALITRNAMFGAFLFSDLSIKLGALAQRNSQHELQSLAMCRVDEAFLRPAHLVDGAACIVEVARLMQAERASSVLVRDGERLGIFTTTGLQRAVLDGRAPAAIPVRELATFALVTIAREAQLFDALALMIEHQVHRLVVTGPDGVVGVLEQLDLLSFLSNHSYLITVGIVRAPDLESLRHEAEKITRFVGILHRAGTRVGQIGRLVQTLNAKLFARTWALTAPPELLDNSCLFVMGSEGRGEQLLKTDQDNGLIVRDGFEIAEATLAAACRRFSDALRTFGYPDCPGGIMVSNPAWRKSATDFAATVRGWLVRPDPEGLMALAIFLDAHSVAGDPSLLEGVRSEVDRQVERDDAVLGHFAAAIDSFPDVLGGWWNHLPLIGDADKTVDLKKAGIFPIVHGVRALALREHIGATSTSDRVEALVSKGRLASELARDLLDSLHFLMTLKLKAGLDELDSGRSISGTVRTDRMTTLERDLFKDALGVVKRFKTLVRHQMHLEMA